MLNAKMVIWEVKTLLRKSKQCDRGLNKEWDEKSIQEVKYLLIRSSRSKEQKIGKTVIKDIIRDIVEDNFSKLKIDLCLQIKRSTNFPVQWKKINLHLTIS
jgi:hypothetical protein